ncbi:MAG: hypothetical protein FWD47_04105 [Treponema sp.]|nr:hypothetical protein [Treponema sp.]
MVNKIIIIGITVLLLSCGGNNQDRVSRDDIIAYMDEYFENVKQYDFKLIESFYSETMYTDTSKEEWNDLLNRIHAILGELVSVKLTSWNIRSNLSTSGSGTTYTFVYNNVYENGESTETVAIFVPRGTKEIGIIGHHFTSNAFLRL